MSSNVRHRIGERLARVGGCVERALGSRRARFWLALALACGVVLVEAVAWARPGGGSSYSGGSSGGGYSSGGGGYSGGSSGGGSSGGGDLAGLVIWLCFEHPVIGVPLLVGIVGFMIFKRVAITKAKNAWSTVPITGGGMPALRTRSARRDLEALQKHDPSFSIVVFEDFLYALYSEVHRARGAGQLHRVSAYVSPRAAQELASQGTGQVDTVIVGAMRFQHAFVALDPTGEARVDVEFESNYSIGGHAVYAREVWRLSRRASARSRDPSRARVLGCPNCGAPQDALFSGTCRHCSQQVNNGSFDWIVQYVRVLERESRGPQLTQMAPEVGTHFPTIVDPNAWRRLEGLRGKDPSFDWNAFMQRVGLVFSQFQAAWAARDLGPMRPFMSDAFFDTQRYWVEAYRAQRLRNITEQTGIRKIELARVTSDAYFDAITVRLHATGLDYTVADDGRHVCGSRSRHRAYTEYWTLIRAVSRKGPTRTDLACPNCGAPLKINMAGNCEYCQVKVTTGEFDWVLSRIEQDDSYTG